MKSFSKSITKYFWGDNLDQLSWEKHEDYIIKTLLEKGDKSAIKWLFQKIDKKNLLQKIKKMRMDQKSKNFWTIYLS